MTIEPKLLSAPALTAIIADFEDSAPERQPRAFTQCLLEHIAALQVALDLERKYRAEDRAEAMQTYDTMTADLAAQAKRMADMAEQLDVRSEQELDSYSEAVRTSEAITVAAIAAWLRERQERPDLALLVEAGTWKVAP